MRMNGQMLDFPKSILRYSEIDASHVASSLEMCLSYMLAFFAIVMLDDSCFFFFFYVTDTITQLENMMCSDEGI